MKNKTIVFVSLALLFFFSGCIPSLHPLYTKDKLVILNQLEGLWTERANESEKQYEKWNFIKKENGQYLLIHEDTKKRKAAFDVNVLQLGDQYFIDFYPVEMPKQNKKLNFSLLPGNNNDMLDIHLLPVHTFAKLNVKHGSVKIQFFDPDYLENLLKRRQIKIRHEELSDKGFVLTASSEELQKFVQKYGHEKEAYLYDAMQLTKTVTCD